VERADLDKVFPKAIAMNIVLFNNYQLSFWVFVLVTFDMKVLIL